MSNANLNFYFSELVNRKIRFDVLQQYLDQTVFIYKFYMYVKLVMNYCKLCILCDASYTLEQLPLDWKTSKVVAIDK